MNPARLLPLLALLAAAPAPPPTVPAFDAPAAWAEFETVLRDEYGYFQRPGIDGPAILAAFAPAARAAPDAAALRRVMQQAARNFADPHLIVGPLTSTDPGIVPTASDLSATFTAGVATVRAVRAGSAAAAQGLAPGDRLRRIDGRSPEDAVAALLGRPFATLSAPQADHGLNIALAGTWEQPRATELTRDGRTSRLTLAPVSVQSKAIEALPPLTTARRGPLCILRAENSLGNNALIAAFDAAIAASLDCPALLLDLRNTPSGGNTTVARAILSHFTRVDAPYQMHRVPAEQRAFGVERQFVEWVRPRAPFYPGRVFVAGGRWTGSMGEGLMIGFDALGTSTVGSPMAHLLGAVDNRTLPLSGAKLDFGNETLFHVNGAPREAFTPRLRVDPAEATTNADPVIDAVERELKAR